LASFFEVGTVPVKLKTSEVNGKRSGSLRSWIRVFRLHFVPTSIYPALLGSVIAWAGYTEFHVFSFVLVIVGVTVNHLGLNMIDDVFDYFHSVDRSHGDQKNPYTGGSGVLSGSLISASSVLGASIICFSITVIIAVYLTMKAGWPVLVFAAIGVFSSLFYTMPPIRYGYRGFGELGLLVNFGPVICLGAFYVQTRMVAWEPFVISLVPGFLMWSMIIINEIPDYEEDRHAGKLNLVARFGRKAGVVLYGAGLICAFGTIVLSVIFRITSPAVLLGLLPVPAAYTSLLILKEKYTDKIRMAPANRAIIKVHSMTLMCLIMGYLASGVLK
jgi:1,4-dihydroxy-2-naphthoate octaprenyltransferase